MDVDQVPTIDYIEQAIQQFCKNENREAAEEYLQDLSKQQYAWDLASQLLRSRDENTQFFGAHTFQVKISRDWKSLPEERKIWLRGELIRLLIHFSNGPSTVITELSTALATYTINAIPNVWTNCIAELFEYLQSALGRQDLAMELLLLEYLTVLPKEVSTAVFIDNQGTSVQKEITDAVPLVMSTLQSFLVQNDQSQRSILLRQKSLLCLESWLTYDVPFKSLLPLISNVIELFSCEETHKAATEVLIRSLDQSSVTLIQDTFCDMMTRCFISEWTRSRIAKAFSESSEDTIKNICRLMAEFGKTFPNYVAKRLTDPDIVIYLEMMLAFTGVPSYYGRQETGEKTLEFWAHLQEAIHDPYVIPIQSNSSEDDNDTALPFDNVASQQSPSEQISARTLSYGEAQKVKQAAAILFKRLIEILRVKLRLLPEEETKPKNRSHRRAR